MKVYISVDLEGVNGVCKFSQTLKEYHNEYYTALEQLHKELNAVIKGVFKANVDHITVNDAHSSMTNLKLTHLDDRVSLVTGKPKLISMMAGLDSSYTAVILLGYHAKAGTPGACLAHTFSENFTSVKINDTEVGEAYLNSLYAATLRVPVALITGDEALKEEVYNQIGDIPNVFTKKSLGYNAIEGKPNSILLQELEESTTKTLNNPTNWIINKVDSPYKLEIELSQIVMADLAELIPGVDRISSRKVRYTHNDYYKVYKALQTVAIVASTAVNYY